MPVRRLTVQYRLKKKGGCAVRLPAVGTQTRADGRALPTTNGKNGDPNATWNALPAPVSRRYRAQKRTDAGGCRIGSYKAKRYRRQEGSAISERLLSSTALPSVCLRFACSKIRMNSRTIIW